MDMPQQPAAPELELEETDEAGTEICLAIGADGSLSVYMEKDGQEQERQAVPDIGGGLRAILDLYKQAAASQGGDPGQEFDAGFSGAPNRGQERTDAFAAARGGRTGMGR